MMVSKSQQPLQESGAFWPLVRSLVGARFEQERAAADMDEQPLKGVSNRFVLPNRGESTVDGKVNFPFGAPFAPIFSG